MQSQLPQSQLRPQAYQVFISSTFIDLAADRKAVREALSDLNLPLASIGICLIPIDLQGGADTNPPLDVCLKQIENCDLVVTLLGHRAGWLVPDGRPITECEFDHATERGIPRLAYMRDASTPVLPEHVDRDDKHVAALNKLRRKIDDTVKRDTFRSPEQLRGHVFRDVLFWILNRPDITSRLRERKSPSVLPIVKRYWDAASSGNISEAVDILTSKEFVLETQRTGTHSTHRELLIDLLELSKLDPPTRVTNAGLRAQLLTELLSEFPESAYATVAMAEARSLREKINHPDYDYRLARAEAGLHPNCEKGMQALKEMLRSARATGDVHTIAEGRRTVTSYYAERKERARAERWYWLSIHKLCTMQEICPFCIAQAFLGIGAEGQQCATMNDRLLKAYLAAKVIPHSGIQIGALLKLSEHLAAHGNVDEAVACVVVAARLVREANIEDSELCLSGMLANLISTRGRQCISDAVQRVGDTADELLGQLIDLHKIGDFAAKLGLKPMLGTLHQHEMRGTA